jgi:hypothetical protein
MVLTTAKSMQQARRLLGPAEGENLMFLSIGLTEYARTTLLTKTCKTLIPSMPLSPSHVQKVGAYAT